MRSRGFFAFGRSRDGFRSQFRQRVGDGNIATTHLLLIDQAGLVCRVPQARHRFDQIADLRRHRAREVS